MIFPASSSRSSFLFEHDLFRKPLHIFRDHAFAERKVTRAAMPRPAPHAKHILAWLFAASCAAHADDVTPSPAAPADPSKLTAGALLMTDYLYRGLSYSAHQPSVGTYVEAQYG